MPFSAGVAFATPPPRSPVLFFTDCLSCWSRFSLLLSSSALKTALSMQVMRKSWEASALPRGCLSKCARSYSSFFDFLVFVTRMSVLVFSEMSPRRSDVALYHMFKNSKTWSSPIHSISSRSWMV